MRYITVSCFPYRLVREIAQDLQKDLRFAAAAFRALQEACEAYVTELFDNAKRFARHAKRATVTKEDIQLARSIAEETRHINA